MTPAGMTYIRHALVAHYAELAQRGEIPCAQVPILADLDINLLKGQFMTKYCDLWKLTLNKDEYFALRQMAKRRGRVISDLIEAANRLAEAPFTEPQYSIARDALIATIAKAEQSC